MIAANLDIYVQQGSTFEREITLKADNTNIPIDHSGITLKGQVRASFGYPVLFNFTFTRMVDQGKFKWAASPAVTSAVKLGLLNLDANRIANLVYDIELTVVATGEIQRIIQGKCRFSAGVTA